MNKDTFYGVKNNIKKTGAYIKKVGIRSTASRVKSYITTHNRYMKWHEQGVLSESERKEHRELSDKLNFKPRISIIVPVFRTKDVFLKQLIDSVIAQTYPNFELVLADGSANKDESSRISRLIRHNYPEEERIVYKLLSDNFGIAGNTNEAIKAATGEWLAFLDHDDYIDEDALFQMAKLLNEKPGLKLIYTDEDKCNFDGTRYFYPHFKPDFNLDLLRASNYICHFLFVRKDVAKKVGNIRSDFDGAQDYDFVLRCVEEIDDERKIGHVAKPLYHWRVHEESTAGSLDSKGYARNAGKKALVEHLLRQDIKGEVLLSEEGEFFRVRYCPEEKPLVSIIIYSEKSLDAKNLIMSIGEQEYRNYEILLYSGDSEIRKEFKDISILAKKLSVYEWKNEPIICDVYNHAVKKCKDELILFADNNIVLRDTSTLGELVSFMSREEVGACSGRIYNPYGGLFHAGMFLGGDMALNRSFYNKKEADGVYFDRSKMSQDFTCLGIEFLMIKKSMFKLAKGFDRTLGEKFAAADFCLKLRVDGYLNVYAPNAKATYTGKPGHTEADETRIRLFKEKWSELLENGDPNYNPNLSLNRTDYSIDVKK